MAISAAARVNAPIGKRALALDGEVCGFPAAVTGGSIYGEFVTEKIGADHLARKHISAVKYEEIGLEVGTDMSKPFYAWVTESLQGKQVRKDGAIYVCDYNFVPRGSLTFQRALVSEVSFPEADAASKDAGKLKVKLAPEILRSSRNPPKEGSKLSPPKQQSKKWLPGNFKLEIDKLDCNKVTKVSPPVARLKIAETAVGELRDYEREASHWDIGNLKVTLAASHADDWYKWHEEYVIEGQCGDDRERNGSLVYFAPDFKAELFRLKFSHLGIFRLHEDTGEAGSEKAHSIEVEMYCEEMELESHGG